MILRRLTEHVKAQNWFAVFLDFLIVVVGVLLAFQINAWGERRAERQYLDAQLASVQFEMRENLDRLAAADDYLATQAARMAALREVLAAPEAGTTEDEINLLIWSAVPVYEIHMKQSAVEALQASPVFAKSSAPALIDQLERWEEALSTHSREQQDGINTRDNIFNPYIIERLPIGSIVRHSSAGAQSLAPSRFTIDRRALADDRTFDSLIAARQIDVVHARAGVEVLAENARQIIELIDAESARS